MGLSDVDWGGAFVGLATLAVVDHVFSEKKSKTTSTKRKNTKAKSKKKTAKKAKK